MTKRIIKLASVITALILLSACGQKGPLYMPPEPETTDPEDTRVMLSSELAQQEMLSHPAAR